jgi:hypothetical protein
MLMTDWTQPFSRRARSHRVPAAPDVVIVVSWG